MELPQSGKRSPDPSCLPASLGLTTPVTAAAGAPVGTVPDPAPGYRIEERHPLPWEASHAWAPPFWLHTKSHSLSHCKYLTLSGI